MAQQKEQVQRGLEAIASGARDAAR